MKKLTNTNHNPPDGYELFMDVKDTLGRTWKYCAAPVRSGSMAYFSKLSDYIRWIAQVEEVRYFADGKPSLCEKIMNAVWSGDLSEAVAAKWLSTNAKEVK